MIKPTEQESEVVGNTSTLTVIGSQTVRVDDN